MSVGAPDIGVARLCGILVIYHLVWNLVNRRIRLFCWHGKGRMAVDLGRIWR
jgi:hypothetical protein